MIEEPPDPSMKSLLPKGLKFSTPARAMPRRLRPLFSKKLASSVAIVALITHSEISLIGTSGYSTGNYETALDLIASRKVRADAMVSHVLPLGDIRRGFELADTKADDAMKVMLELSA